VGVGRGEEPLRGLEGGAPGPNYFREILLANPGASAKHSIKKLGDFGVLSSSLESSTACVQI